MKVAICIYAEPWLKVNFGMHAWKNLKQSILVSSFITSNHAKKIRWIDQTKGALTLYRNLWACYTKKNEFDLESMLRDCWKLTTDHFHPEYVIEDSINSIDIIFFETCLKEGYTYLKDIISKSDIPYIIYPISLLQPPGKWDRGLPGSRLTMTVDYVNNNFEDIKDDIIYEITEILKETEEFKEI